MAQAAEHQDSYTGGGASALRPASRTSGVVSLFQSSSYYLRQFLQHLIRESLIARELIS